MSVKMNVVYVGPKAKKSYPYQGRKLVFPQFQPVEIEQALAFQLLEHPDVFVEPDQVAAIKEKIEADKKAAAERAAAKEQAIKDEIKANSGMVLVNGQAQDLNKKNTAQLKTIIAAESLNIDVAEVKRKGDETQLQALKRVVKDALIEKNGEPEEE